MRNLTFLYLIEFFAGLSRGAYLVCIGWTTLIITGDVAVVGQVFVVAMLTTIVLSPILGTIVDRHNRKTLAIAAHIGIAVAMAIMGLALAIDAELPSIWFFITVIVVSASRMLFQSCMDALIQANVTKEKILHSIARFRTTHLLATAVGTALTGIIINSMGASSGFLFAAFISILIFLTSSFVKGVVSKENAPGLAGFYKDFISGLKLFRSSASLRTLIIITAIATPVGQLSNAVLSSFMRDDLGLGADDFGFVDAAWPIGGMLAAALLSLGIKKLTLPNIEYFLCFLVGIVTIIFSFMNAIIPLALVHAALGFGVWMCGIIIDGRILQMAAPQDVGRTKAFIQIAFAVIAMIMSLSPSLIKLPSSSDYFLYWGIIILVGAILLALVKIASSVQSTK